MIQFLYELDSAKYFSNNFFVNLLIETPKHMNTKSIKGLQVKSIFVLLLPVLFIGNSSWGAR
ncbi:MAG: hypothetical protein EBR30_28095 [Cytophagia bacterium]|nr:hypothetical protein [Cytophagia bacterium]